jgi:ABC-type transport system involved in multi-copper enzyme maturation permease subunit
MIPIAMTSLKEALRKKVILLVGILTLIYLIILALITYYVYPSGSSIVDLYTIASTFISVLGFYFSSMLVAFLTIMLSVGSVSSEIESGILHSIITRPVKRSSYILGKYLGIALLIVSYSVLLYLGLILIYWAITPNLIASFNLGMILKGLFFFILEPLAILSLSIFSSTSFKTLGSGIFVIAIYILGLLGGILEQVDVLIDNDVVNSLGIFSSLISPFDVIYRELISNFFSGTGFTNPFLNVFSHGDMTSGSTPSSWMLLYVFVYIIGLILLSIRKFKKRDIS